MKKFKIFKKILLCALVISFTACSSDDDSPGTPDGSGAVKVKEFKRITTQTDFVINGIENSMIYEYNDEGKVNRVVNKVVNQNPADNYEYRYTIHYNTDQTVQRIDVVDTEFGENTVVNFNYTGGRLSSLSYSEGEPLLFSYNSATNTYSCVLDPEFPDFVVSVSFNSANDVTGFTGLFGTQQVSTNSNEGIYAGTSMNQELKVYFMLVGDPVGNNGFFQSKEITQIHASGETIFGPIEPITVNMVNVVRNSAGLITSYQIEGGDPRFEITYVE